MHDSRDAPAKTALIRLGVHGATGLYLSILAGTGRTYRDVQWVQYPLEDPFSVLRLDLADLLVAKYTLHEPDLDSSDPVAWDGRAAVLGEHHPLADREQVTLAELAEFDAFRCPGQFPGYVWDRIVPPRTPSGTPIRRVHQMTTVSAMVELLRTTNAVHLSFASLASAVPPDMRIVSIKDLFGTWCFYLAARSWHGRAPRPRRVSRSQAVAHREAPRVPLLTSTCGGGYEL